MTVRLKDNANAINAACKLDLGKGHFETNLTELDFCTNDIVYVCNSLEKWAKDEKAPDIGLSNALLFPKIRKDPLGCVLIIGYVIAGEVACASFRRKANPCTDLITSLSILSSALLLAPSPLAIQLLSSLARTLPMSLSFCRRS